MFVYYLFTHKLITLYTKSIPAWSISVILILVSINVTWRISVTGCLSVSQTLLTTFSSLRLIRSAEIVKSNDDFKGRLCFYDDKGRIYNVYMFSRPDADKGRFDWACVGSWGGGGGARCNCFFSSTMWECTVDDIISGNIVGIFLYIKYLPFEMCRWSQQDILIIKTQYLKPALFCLNLMTNDDLSKADCECIPRHITAAWHLSSISQIYNYCMYFRFNSTGPCMVYSLYLKWIHVD